MNRIFSIVAAILLSVSSAAFAGATHYSISGTGSGILDGIAFTDAAFSIDLVGDPAIDNNRIDPLSSATFTISGRGTGAFSFGTLLGFNQPAETVYFSKANSDDLFDFVITPSGALTSLVGPFSVTGTGVFSLDQFVDAGTSLGALTFVSSSSVAFVAAPVPEPETWSMLLAGLGMIASIARRRLN